MYSLEYYIGTEHLSYSSVFCSEISRILSSPSYNVLSLAPYFILETIIITLGSRHGEGYSLEYR
jgi:hypothetical protein